MIPKLTSAITPQDIEALITAPRLEDRQIDYKLELPGGSDDDKREFLADVVAFANALGGDILFGIEETNGAPTAARGVPVDNFDELRLRLQNLIREAVEPTIPRIEIVPIGEFSRGPVIFLRIHQSWHAPHMVTYKRWSRFFMRDPGQRHQMDVQELRAAFLAADAVEQRIRAFRDARVAAIARGDTPAKLFNQALLVVHVLPLGSAFGTQSVDPSTLRSHLPKLLANDLIYGGSVHFNLDGLLIRSGQRDAPTDSYVQVFRNGGIEAAANFVASDHAPPAIYGSRVEKEVVSFAHAAREFRRAAALDTPMLLSTAFLRVADLSLQASRPEFGRQFDRDTVILPETVLTESEHVSKPLHVTFTAMWQAAGWSGSPYYDADGNWRPPAV